MQFQSRNTKLLSKLSLYQRIRNFFKKCTSSWTKTLFKNIGYNVRRNCLKNILFIMEKMLKIQYSFIMEDIMEKIA